ncbi:hypothetical protein [Sphingomonas sp. PAMC 26605]|uniref:hypothetical protein n=1 Tax=Sphingomonas sp. PAMC 26605 TaxID=1112214 RepID=UPI0012F4DC44|nr:hypothetical protein [Sphingomonas sp. PAMC 26605]
MAEAHVFGVVAGTLAEPRIAYLKHDAKVGAEVIDRLGTLDPTLIFRYSGVCENSACGQFDNGRCGLGHRILEQLMPVVDTLPSCQIRATCRWHQEQGDAICLRCPQVMTRVPPDQTQLRAAARRPDADRLPPAAMVG